MKINMPKKGLWRSWLIKTQTSFSHFVHMSAWQKSLYHYHYFFLTLFIIVSFQNLNDVLFVKQLSKAFTKFCRDFLKNGQNIGSFFRNREISHVCLCHARTVHPYKWRTHPSFEKKKEKRLNQIFNMSLCETQPKIKIDHTFAFAWCTCSKLYNLFGETFLFDVSIFL